MGKKGKVLTKKLKVMHRAQKKKEAKQEKRLAWRSRRPLSHELQTVQDGIAEAIEAQGGEPGPISYFLCIGSLLASNPDPKKLPYFLALLDYNLPLLSEPFLMHHFTGLLDSMSKILGSFAADPLVVRKAMTVVRTLFLNTEPSALNLQRLGVFEPNKLHAELMTLYMKTLESVFLYTFRRAPTLVYSAIVPLVRGSIQNLFETKEEVARASAACLESVLVRATTRAMVTLQRESLDQSIAMLHDALRDPQYRQNWDLICKVLAALAARLATLRGSLSRHAEAFAGSEGPYVALRGIAETADRLRALDDFHFNSAAESLVGAIARCVPVAALLRLLPLDITDSDPIRGRHYLLSALRRNVGHDSLQYFLKEFAPLTAVTKQRAEQCLVQGLHVEAKTLRVLRQQIWDLLPAFCTYPNDITAGNTMRIIAKEMSGHLGDPDLSKIVCRCFVLLIEKNKHLANAPTREERMREAADAMQDDGDEEEDEEEEDDAATQKTDESDEEDELKDDGDDDESLDPVEKLEAAIPGMMDSDFHEAPKEEDDPHGYHGIPVEVAKENVQLLATFSRNILPLVCNAVEREQQDRRALLLAVLRSYSSIAPADQLNTIFQQVHNTLQASSAAAGDDKEAALHKAQAMMDIGCVLGEYLDEGSLTVLLSIIQPIILDPAMDPLLQKKSYKALARVCKTRKDFVEKPEFLRALVNLLGSAAGACNSGSRRERLQCLAHLAISHSESPGMLREYIGQVLPEVLLGVKEANSRTREMAFYCLQVIAELLSPTNEDGAVDGTPICKLVIAGLGGTTPALVSGTILGLAKLLQDYGTGLPESMIEPIVRSGLMLVQHRSNEIKNAALAFAKVVLRLAARRPVLKQVLSRNFETLVVGCLAWISQVRVPGNTRRTIRQITERAIRRFGYEWVKDFFPEEHKRYVDYVFKEWQREVRKKQREKEERRADAMRLRVLRSGSGRAGSRLALRDGDADEARFDLLDTSAASTFVPQGQRSMLDAAVAGGRKDEFNVTLDDEGGVVVESEDAHRRRVRQRLLEKKLAEMKGAERGGLEELSGGILKRKRRADDDDDDDDADILAEQERARSELRDLAKSLRKSKAQASGTRLVDKTAKRSRHDMDIRSGKQFQGSGVTGGDVKKGGLDPYAFVPLNARFLNKRYIKHSSKRISTVDHKVLRGSKAKRKGGISAVQQAAANIAKRDAKIKGQGGKKRRKK
eukprot:TRINITY_DN1884_c0_g1_i1.p1 TRINITY_DN1884_c0_g1~~TRINITY_DN1884_c0_g1_i1.p1  ORF type:complete len:1216 (+),score=454.50 TRINITY_DN1884_c0_g1_i1:90-3737(+)